MCGWVKFNFDLDLLGSKQVFWRGFYDFFDHSFFDIQVFFSFRWNCNIIVIWWSRFIIIMVIESGRERDRLYCACWKLTSCWSASCIIFFSSLFSILYTDSANTKHSLFDIRRTGPTSVNCIIAGLTLALTSAFPSV